MKTFFIILVSLFMVTIVFSQEKSATTSLIGIEVREDIDVVQLFDKYLGQISDLIKSAEQPVKDLYAGLVRQVVVVATWNVVVFGIFFLIALICGILLIRNGNKIKSQELNNMESQERDISYALGVLLTIGAMILFITTTVAFRKLMIVSSNPEWFALKEMLTIIK